MATTVVAASTVIATAPVAPITMVIAPVIRTGRYYHCRTWMVIVGTRIIWLNRRIIAIASIVTRAHGGCAAAQQHNANAQSKNY